MRPLRITLVLLAVGVFGLSTEARAGAARTTYPVVFAHGMGGFDDILGFDYWGDDYGTFVGDPCDAFMELHCNRDLDARQKAFAAQVAPFQSSEVRGLDLANDIEGFMATAGTSRVNIIGHSQGGLDARKAARVLYQRRGYTVVSVLVSVSSPHRGSPLAKHVLDQGSDVTSIFDALARIYGDIVYEPGSDGLASAKQFVYDDYDPNDGQVTGMKAFNATYPVDTRYASRYASLLTAQHGLSVNPVLSLARAHFFNIDGDGYCQDDCDNDGAGGAGDGWADEADDDGLVGINAQQMGYRLSYTPNFFGFDWLGTDWERGYVGNLNAPSPAQMTSMSSVILQDHLDVIGVGPDLFNEPEFYATLIDYIATHD